MTKTLSPKEVQVGTPATVVVGSDRYPAEVTKVSEKCVWVRFVEALICSLDANGDAKSFVTGEQVGDEKRFSVRKNGWLVATGTPNHSGIYLSVGKYDFHRNPSF